MTRPAFLALPRRLLLLGSTCMIAAALPASADVRGRLLPTKPSVEVYFQALDALRESSGATAGGYGGWQAGPAGVPLGSSDSASTARTPAAPAYAASPKISGTPFAAASVAPLKPKSSAYRKPGATAAEKAAPRIAKAPVQPQPKPTEVASIAPVVATPAPARVANPIFPGPDGTRPAAPVVAPANRAPANASVFSQIEDTHLRPTAPAPTPYAAPPEPAIAKVEPTPAPVQAAPAPTPMETAKTEPAPAPVATSQPRPEPMAETAKMAADSAPKPVETAKLDPAPPVQAAADPAPNAAEIAKGEPAPKPTEAQAEPKPTEIEIAKPTTPEPVAPVEVAASTPVPSPVPAEPKPMEMASLSPAPVPAASTEPPVPEVTPTPAEPIAPPADPSPTASTPTPPAMPIIPPAPAKGEGMFPTLKQKFASLIGRDEPKPAPLTTPPALEASAASPAANGVAGLPPLPPESAAAPSALPSAVPSASSGQKNEALALVERQNAGAEGLAGLPPLPAENEVPGKKTELPPLPKDGSVPPLSKIPSAVEPVEATELASLTPTTPVTTASDATGALPPIPTKDTASALAPKQVETAMSTPPPTETITPPKPDTKKDDGKADVLGKKSGKAAIQITFSQAETDVPLSAQSVLKELARKLLADKEASVSVIAYANGPAELASLARRVSLSRALAVRAFLIDSGIDNMRISVQAKGNNIPENTGPSERADIYIE